MFLFRLLPKNLVLCRQYMSSAFKCSTEWDMRIKSPILQKLDMSKFFYEIERKFQREKRGSAIDIDLFANAASGETQLEQLEELLHQFRRTPQTFQTLPSTTHATIRSFVAADRTDNLMRMIEDRLNYGLFPDHYCLVYMLDHFLETENWRDASKVAAHMMLQEDIDVPVAREMGLLGTFKYAILGTPEPWEPQGTDPEPEPEDDVKVRLDYLPTGYFDDHFDLIKMEHIIGKTLIKFNAKFDSKKFQSIDVLGWTMFEKWDKLEETLKSIKEIDELVAVKVTEIINSHSNETWPPKENLISLIKSITKADLKMEEELKTLVNESVASHEQSYIDEIVKDFSQWNQRREVEMEKQFKMYERESRKEAVLKKRREMNEKEEKLFFFERKEDFDRFKEEKELEWRKKLPSRRWTKRITLKPKVKVADDYVPPEIGGKSRRE